MKVAFFSAKSFDRESFEAADAAFGHQLTYFEPRLTVETSALAIGFPAVCAFVHDQLDAGIRPPGRTSERRTLRSGAQPEGEAMRKPRRCCT